MTSLVTVELVRRKLADAGAPLPAHNVRHGLSLSIEDVYAALVWLYDRGMVRIVSGHPRAWELMPCR